MSAHSLHRTERLLDRIELSPTAFHATSTAAAILEEAGFRRIEENDFPILHTGKYYIMRNGSSLIAFDVPQFQFSSAMICASHSDSPMFKLKPNPNTDALGIYTMLNTEKYGGMILSSWMDRPLSVAGRLVIREGQHIKAVNVNVDRDLLIIPNVCIHFRRDVNENCKYDPAVDMLPLAGMKGGRHTVLSLIAEQEEIDPSAILASDLYVYNRTPGTVLGVDREFFSAPRIDDLQCAFGTLDGFLAARDTDTLRVWCLFDNEEVGSSTKQGAASFFLRDILERICLDNDVSLQALLASSMMISADNAHARHPNHPEFSDPQNSPNMNGGIVLKSNAAQKYTTDAVSAAVFREICRKAGVPVQDFANRSNIAGGSTLGNIANTKVPLMTADIGMAQLAMHSAYETAGCSDNDYLFQGVKAFFESELRLDGEQSWKLN